jgi:SAM-dependent methyltransferase
MDVRPWYEAWTGVALGAVTDAVRQLNVRRGARVLDVGTGGGVALPALAQSVGPDGWVVAIDVDAAAVEVARRRVAAASASRVNVRHGRIEDLIEQSGSLRFDAIWAGDVLWRNYFASPAAVVKQLVRLLDPRGAIGVFTGNWYSSRFLWGYPDLERGVLAASARRWHVPADGSGDHHEVVAAWLAAAGLSDVSVSVHSIVGTRAAGNWPSWQEYLETVVWPEYRAAVRESATCAEIDEDGTRQLERLTSLGTPEDITARPGYLALQPAMLVQGRFEP